MVNFFVETYYNLEILSSNMAFAVISVHSTYCQTLYFIFCIISRRLEKKFSDWRNVNRRSFWRTRHTFKNQIDHACSNKLLFVVIRDKLTIHHTTKADIRSARPRSCNTRARPTSSSSEAAGWRRPPPQSASIRDAQPSVEYSILFYINNQLIIHTLASSKFALLFEYS